MARISIGIGAFLIVLGVIGYIAGGASSFTALIPALFGVALAGLGAWATKGSSAEKNAMHIATVVGLIGALAPLARVVPALTGGGELGLAFLTNLLMFIACGAFVALCVRSFVLARKARTTAGAQ